MRAFRRYREVLVQPGARSLLLLAVLARMGNIPFGAILTAMAYISTGSWLVAGLAGGGATASSALTSWGYGRLLDRWGASRVLLASSPGALAVLFLVPARGSVAVIFLALLVGALKPPSGTVVRSAWQRKFKDDVELRSAAYGLDSSLSPIAGALGAAVGALLLSGLGEATVGFFLAGLLLSSSLGLYLHPAVAGIVASGRPGRKEAAPPLPSPVRLALASGFASWAALGGVEIAIGVLWGPETMLWASSLSIFTVALGAFGFTGRAGRQPALVSVRSGLVASLLSLLALSLLMTLDPLLAVLAAATLGFGRGLIASAAVEALAESAPERRMSEVMGLYGSGTLLGQAGYRPLAALLVGVFPALGLLGPAILCGALAITIAREESTI